MPRNAAGAHGTAVVSWGLRRTQRSASLGWCSGSTYCAEGRTLGEGGREPWGGQWLWGGQRLYLVAVTPQSLGGGIAGLVQGWGEMRCVSGCPFSSGQYHLRPAPASRFGVEAHGLQGEHRSARTALWKGLEASPLALFAWSVCCISHSATIARDWGAAGLTVCR